MPRTVPSSPLSAFLIVVSTRRESDRAYTLVESSSSHSMHITLCFFPPDSLPVFSPVFGWAPDMKNDPLKTDLVVSLKPFFGIPHSG